MQNSLVKDVGIRICLSRWV